MSSDSSQIILEIPDGIELHVFLEQLLQIHVRITIVYVHNGKTWTLQFNSERELTLALNQMRFAGFDPAEVITNVHVPVMIHP